MRYGPNKTSATRTIDDNLDYVDWQPVYTISDPVNRQIILDALECANVRTILKSHDNDAYGGILDHRFAPGCGQILVERQEIELATEIITTLLDSLSSTDSTYLDE
ncbi:hypothetical protein CMK13_06810 [Candidatus Poribacteria bacterium]|nr:hypothetical protein [Candidatus Poribacteria bacterium]MBF75870.1 hypothetical protein [Candidatus Poribacteria bacterium]MBP95861.1 hypothetical protein [Candidatus Poribacteria bacterium]OUT63387.1 MAG: hypothetical protein CBB75_06285 [bacterium TMED15]